jgi:hypothetical protein
MIRSCHELLLPKYAAGLIKDWAESDDSSLRSLGLANTFVGFDYPGATNTSLNGINQAGFISGRYTDTSGIRHGFLAKAKYVKPTSVEARSGGPADEISPLRSRFSY